MKVISKGVITIGSIAILGQVTNLSKMAFSEQELETDSSLDSRFNSSPRDPKANTINVSASSASASTAGGCGEVTQSIDEDETWYSNLKEFPRNYLEERLTEYIEEHCLSYDQLTPHQKVSRVRIKKEYSC